MAFDFSATYDERIPDEHDYRFYAERAGRCCALRVIDLGCRG